MHVQGVDCVVASIKGLRNVLSRATATSGLRWMSMGQSELTSLARNDVTSLVCGMNCLAVRVDVLVAGVVGTICMHCQIVVWESTCRAHCIGVVYATMGSHVWGCCSSVLQR